MSDMKCPFCQQELEIGGVDDILRGCPKCRNLGTEMLWQELIRTRKALDKAIWWLNEIVENHRFTPISTAEKALAEIKQITETKEVK